MTIEAFQKQFGIIGKSKEIRDLVDIIMQVAPSDISALIYGESGTGKEVFARALHGASRRSDQDLISVNCGAIPEGILESELFGHTKGAFTGATGARKGYFELADQGTLFLDEIAEMPLTTQVKLLRAIELREFMRIGAETITKVDVRFIAATNKDLQVEVDAKRFREDLYFRLKAVTFYIPPLRKRKQDIPELARHFLREFEKANRYPELTIEQEAYELMQQYSWPGNVRELRNSIETAAALAREGVIDRALIAPLLQMPKASENKNLPVIVGKSSEEVDREFIYRALFELKKDIVELKHLLLENQRPDTHHQPDYDETMTIQEAERRAIIAALREAHGNKRKAALILNMSERTLYRKMKEYTINNF